MEKWESLAASRPTNWTCTVGNNRDIVLNQKARNGLQECPLTSTHVVWHMYNHSHRQAVTQTHGKPKKYKSLKKSPADFYPHSHTHACAYFTSIHTLVGFFMITYQKFSALEFLVLVMESRALPMVDNNSVTES